MPFLVIREAAVNGGQLRQHRTIPALRLKHRSVYVNCQTGLRSYLACRLLTQYGFTCAHLSGGYSFYRAVTKEQKTARSAYPCGMEKL